MHTGEPPVALLLLLLLLDGLAEEPESDSCSTTDSLGGTSR